MTKNGELNMRKRKILQNINFQDLRQIKHLDHSI